MKYKIPVVWQMWGDHEIEADTLEEAISEAKNKGLPYDGGHYIDDSFEVDLDGIELVNPNLSLEDLNFVGLIGLDSTG